MEKRIRLRTVIALLVAVVAVTFAATFWYAWGRFNSKLADRAALDAEMAKYIEAREQIEKSFIGTYDESKLLDGAVGGMVTGLGDRWSHYLSKDQYAAYQETVKNEYAGIGAVVESEDTSDGLHISKVYANSPAAGAGLAAGDVITGVDGTSVAGMEVDEAKALIRGEKGTAVKLAVKKADGSQTEVSLQRAVVNIPVVTQEMLPGNIGLITIANFDSNAASEFKKAVESLKTSGATRLIFDVRNNPGGQLTELLDILDYLLPEGTTFISKDKQGNEKTYTSDASCVEMPMTVLANADSYSAAEFFAAALQEYGWASVVGVQTFGKGYSQVPVLLSDGSAIILSTNEYFTPRGISLIGKGITPDYKIQLSDADEKLLEADKLPHISDGQLQKAVSVVQERQTPDPAQVPAEIVQTVPSSAAPETAEGSETPPVTQTPAA